MLKGLANVGDVLAGKYRVDKILGIGGMGMVVAATNLDLDQQVALKFMLQSAMESPEASARFMREARAAGKLTSEHVCRVSDVGRFESGAPYIVMEYLEGYDLNTMLRRRGPLRVAAAVDYILQACEGLAEAHAQGIVHRDLKPDNLYLAARADGGHVIKVLDFGISKAAVTGIATQTGEILGSPAYMAPEQMRSTKDVDQRADIWSMGVVMYQLLTGRLPFSGDSLPNLCLSVLNDDPLPPNQIRQDLPDGLSETIMRCLAKDREDRYANVGDLAEALGPFATPAGSGSVTRVRSALKGRQAPPDPSQTIPHGFEAQRPGASGSGAAAAVVVAGAGAISAGPISAGPISAGPISAGPLPAAPLASGEVPPTLHGTQSDLGGAGASDLFAPRLPSPDETLPLEAAPPEVAPLEAPPFAAPPVIESTVGVTTMSSSSGESIEMTKPRPRRPRFPVGLVSGLVGAIGVVLVLIVMVLRSGDRGASPEAAPSTRSAAQPEAPRPPPPKVTPIEEPADGAGGDPGAGSSGGPGGPGAGVDPGVDPVAVQPGAPTGPQGSGAGPRTQDPRAGRPPNRPRTGTNPRRGSGAPGGGSGDDDVTVTDDPPNPPAPTPDAGVTEEDRWGRMHHDQMKKEQEQRDGEQEKSP